MIDAVARLEAGLTVIHREAMKGCHASFSSCCCPDCPKIELVIQEMRGILESLKQTSNLSSVNNE
jgi:hypothetical protein